MRLPWIVWILALGCVPGSQMLSAAEQVSFTRDVLPLLQRFCWECHGSAKQEGQLRLDQAAAARRGGDSGPAWVAGKSHDSELLRRVRLPAGDPEVMPSRGQRLTDEQIEVLQRWIDQGAEWPADAAPRRHWSYLPPQRPSLPAVAHPQWLQTPIDAFVQERQSEHRLAPAPRADKATLARRVYLDLVGLPPTPAEVDAFLEDSRPDAYLRLVDRLLASDQFGARWAQPWLDYARYADSHGFQRDDFRDVWAFRDWVIRAFNQDLPYDQFTIEQLAGDLLPQATRDQHIATGFARNAPTNVEAGTEPEETRVNQIFDRVNTVGMVWLGMTLECAQCHDHKYDPFTMRDYYGLFAYFNQTELEADRANPQVPGSIRFLGPEMELTTPQHDSARQPLLAQMANVERELAAIDSGTAPVTPTAPAPTQPAVAKPDAAGKKKLQAKKKRLETELQKLKPPTTLVMRQVPKPRASFVFQRGNYLTPGDAVSPTTPALFSRRGSGESATSSSATGDGTRLDLARWLISEQNPLVARVAVNRWWSELFGRGLVGTPEDFGLKGEPPTHPALLDWLAVEYRAQGWSLKSWLRTVVLSATYQQTAVATPDALSQDEPNRWYTRGPRGRLAAEAIRDNALAIGGLLNLNHGGPPIRPYQPDGLWVKVGGQRYDYEISPGGEAYRRGVYVVWKRGAPYPSFVNFDANNRFACRVRRPRSNTPVQALTLLNDPVYVEAAVAFAQRILRETPTAPLAARLRHAFRLAVAREPREDELEILVSLYRSQTESAGANPTVPFAERFPAPDGVSREEYAAWYAVATAVLNLDEAICKP